MGQKGVSLAVFIALVSLIAIFIPAQTNADTGTASACFNHPPVIDAIGSQNAYVDSEFFLQVNASDADPQNLTFDDNSTLFDINSSTGIINFTPSSAGTYYIKINVSDNSNCSNSYDSIVFSLTIQQLAGPNASISGLNISVVDGIPKLMWNSTGADNFTVYYNDDLNELLDYNIGSPLGGISTVTGITADEYNDTSYMDSQIRYYRVSVISGSDEILSNQTVGKYTYDLIGINTGSNDNKRKNWVSIIFNESVDAETFISEIPDDYGIRVAKLIRDDADSFSYFGHEKGGGNNFNMTSGLGYQVEVSQNVSYTLAGFPVTDTTAHSLFGKSSGTNDNYRKNWISIGYSSSQYDAESYISGVPDDYGIRIARLIRENSDTYSYFTHEKGGGNNFTMYKGVGYQVEVSGNASYSLS